MPPSSLLPSSSFRAQRGFSLIISLIMLIVIIILGISAAQMAVNEERGARNDRDRQIAFQAAEAALKDGEAEVFSSIVGCPTRTAIPPSTGNPAGTGLEPGGGRAGTVPLVCFNQSAGVGFASLGTCATGAAAGLCDGTTSPAYLSAAVNFYKDAIGTGNGNTVQFGQFTSKVFPSQATVVAPNGQAQPISKYPPRYIIERVFKNIVLGDAPGKYMFRVTAMGFGANPNSQVVLQSVVSTEN